MAEKENDENLLFPIYRRAENLYAKKIAPDNFIISISLNELP